MSLPEDTHWRDLLAEQRRYEAVRDAVAKELARTYGSVAKEPLPADMARILDAQQRAEGDEQH